MTYTFKLARRLALGQLAWLAVVAVFESACSAGEPTASTSGTNASRDGAASVSGRPKRGVRRRHAGFSGAVVNATKRAASRAESVVRPR